MSATDRLVEVALALGVVLVGYGVLAVVVHFFESVLPVWLHRRRVMREARRINRRY